MNTNQIKKETIPIYLSAGQSYLIRSSDIMGSLSGTTICSEQPFALFNGGQSVTIPSGGENHIFHNSYPTDLYGKTFIVTPTYYAVYDYIRITAAEDNTEVYRDGTLITTLQALETFQDTLKSTKYYLEDDETIYYNPTAAIYTTSNPTECYLYGTGNSINGAFNSKDSKRQEAYDYGSPVMTSIVPQELAMRSCIFATFEDITQNEMRHYVNIVTPTSEVSGMRLDGSNIANKFKAIPSSPYSFAIIEVSDTAHFLENTRNKSNSTFTARVYGLGKSSSAAESYAYSAGSRISRSADLLIDGAYIKRKEICITDAVTFKPIINYDFENYYFSYFNTDSTNYPTTTPPQTTPTDFTYTFTEAGRWEVDLIVERTTPICDLLLRDTIRTNIIVHDTKYLNYGYSGGKSPNICYGEDFYVYDNQGKRYDYIADTTTVQEIYGIEQTFKLNQTYTFVDTFQNNWGCDSIISYKVCIRPTYEYTVYDTICQKEAPYTYIDPITGKVNTGKLSKLTKSGYYVDSLHTRYGCDSIIHLHLLINPDYRIPTIKTICSTQDFYWQGKHYVGEDFPTISEGDIVVESNKTHYDSINYPTSALHHCDSIYHLTLSVQSYHDIKDTIYYCESDLPYIDKDFPDIKVYGDTTYTKTLTSNIGGCDSIVNVHVDVGETYNISTDSTICERELPWKHVIEDSKGNKYVCEYPLTDLGGKPVDTVYTYTLTTAGRFDCDSTVSIHLHILPSTIVKTSVQWCKSAGPYKFENGTKEWEESGNYTDTLTIQNHYGCDSILHLHLEILSEIITRIDTMICDNELPFNHTNPLTTKLHNLTETGIYYDTLQTALLGCDSIIELHLTVNKTYHDIKDTIYYCESDLPYIDKDINTIQAYGDTNYTKTLTTTIGGCDSIVNVQVLIGKTYDISIDTTICERELPWKYVMEDSKGNRYECEYAVTDLGGKPVDTVYTHTLTTAGRFDCDSTVNVHLHILPSTIIDTTVIWCKSAGEYTFGGSSKSWTESGDYIDTLIIPNHYNCDSILHLHLEVLQNIITRIDTMICDNELPFSHADPLTTNLHNLTKTGVYYDTLQTALLGCDSIIELHLTVNKTYHIYDIQHICDNEEYLFNDSLFACPAGYYEYDTLLYTAHGCDSLVTLQLHVYPTYRFEQVDSVCQDTVNTYDWVDEYGGVHPMIDISKAGDFTLFDTLKTIHGCDSIYGLRLHVKPIYRFDSIYTACDDEVIYWQGKQYSGIKADPMNGLEAGVYYDTVFYQTQEGCDSTYYLQYVFYPTYDTTIYVSACYDGTDGLPYYWETHDNGNNESYVDTIDIDLFDNTESSKQFTRLLHTTHGCDSLVHLQLSVHPTYRFITDTTICSNEFVTWRGKRYRQEGIYYDSLQTEIYGCDSIYELRLHVKPAYLIELFAGKRCDNEYYVLPNELTGLWSDTIFFRKDTINYGADELREEIYTRTFFTEEGCDSIYKIHVTVCPAYFVQEDIDTICSNEPYLWHGTTYHLQPGLHKLDTTFITINGCDSTFSKNVYVKRAYHFYQTDSICQDEEVHWQNRVLKDLPPGTHQFDTIYSTCDGCDSTYTEYITVFPTYYNHVYDTICDNETYLWQNQVLTLTEGAYHYDTTYTTIHGCDSIWALDLVVHPTTEEIVYDTICAGEWYVLSNKQVNTTGYYIDTTTNEFGCNHYIHLYLEVVPPTRLTAHIDTICADDKAFEITYHYQGSYPIEYSVYFTNEGLSQGFEDIIHAPIVDLTDSTISIEIPRGEELPKPNERYYDGVTHQFTTNPKYQYVQPDIYTIKVYLHNGICSDDTLAYDYVDALIQYPHWIHEQHWNDAIVIYKDTFNGGYEFTNYQWYENGKPLEGETGDYLYLPHNLQQDAYYQVALTRKSDGKTFMTCPITAAFDVDSIVPRLPYFSVVPTLVYTSHPYVSILCSMGGYYEIYHPMGTRVQERKRFEPEYDASILQQNPALPANVMKDDIYLDMGEGLYIIKLIADNGEQRTIKIVVTDEKIY